MARAHLAIAAPLLPWVRLLTNCQKEGANSALFILEMSDRPLAVLCHTAKAEQIAE